MSIFEAIMMVCFGASWPLAIIKTYKSKNPAGKSIPFLVMIEIGYLSGILHKIFGECDWVITLYILNFIMVAADIVLTLYYLKRKVRLED